MLKVREATKAELIEATRAYIKTLEDFCARLESTNGEGDNELAESINAERFEYGDTVNAYFAHTERIRLWKEHKKWEKQKHQGNYRVEGSEYARTRDAAYIEASKAEYKLA